MQLRSRHFGALVGLGLGWLIVQYGLFKAVFVAVIAALGWFVGRVLDGETRLSDYIRAREERDLE